MTLCLAILVLLTNAQISANTFGHRWYFVIFISAIFRCVAYGSRSGYIAKYTPAKQVQLTAHRIQCLISLLYAWHSQQHHPSPYA